MTDDRGFGKHIWCLCNQMDLESDSKDDFEDEVCLLLRRAHVASTGHPDSGSRSAEVLADHR